MCLCCHPVRCCLSQMGHADWIWYCDVAVKDALLPRTQETSNSLTDGKALCKLSNSFSWKVYCTCKDRSRWGVKTSYSRSLHWVYCSFPEQKQKGCCASGHLCKDKSDSSPQQNLHRLAGCVQSGERLLGGPITFTGDSSVPVWKHCWAKPLSTWEESRRWRDIKADGAKQRWEGGRASESINTKTIYGPSTIRPSLLKGRCKRVLAFLYETEKERTFLAISDSKILTLCNSMHVNWFCFFCDGCISHTKSITAFQAESVEL